MQLVKIDNVVYVKQGKKLFYLSADSNGVIVMVQVKEIRL